MFRNEYNRFEMHPLPPVNTNAKLMVVGSYPSLNEIKAGQFFQSEGAHVLNETLKVSNIPLEEVHYTVAIPYLVNSKQTMIPEDRYKREHERLIAEAKQSGAKAIMLLGNTAVDFLMGVQKAKISKLAGNIFYIDELPNVALIPNIHPAALLHNGKDYKIFKQIVETASIFCQDRKLHPGVTRSFTVNNIIDYNTVYEKCKAAEHVSADLETSSLLVHKARIWVMGVSWAENETAVFPKEWFEKPELLAMTRKLFKLPCRWIWHNGKYDTKILRWQEIDEARHDEDTIYLHYALDETSKHGLGILATLFLGADEYKSAMNAEFANITDEAAYHEYKDRLCERVAVDADYTRQIFNILEPRVKKQEKLYGMYRKMLINAAQFLRKVELRGAKVDTDYLESRKPIYEAEIESRLKDVIDAAQPFWDPELYKIETGAKSASAIFKPTSVKQLQWLLYRRLKLKPAGRIKKSKNGLPGTSEEILEAIPDKPEFLTKLLELRKFKKKYKTYVLSYLECKDDDDLVHANFNLHTTATGRLSCTDPNLQNVPSHSPEIRRAFIPRGKDRILMEVDYSGAELRVLAYVSGDVVLTKALIEGDPHGELAEKIFGERYTNGTPEVKKDLRGRAKTVNFGVAYGREADSISEAFDISKEEAQNYIDVWGEMYPQAWAYLQSCGEDVKAGRTIETPYGRQRRFGLVTKYTEHSSTNEAKNCRIQSISSDNLLIACMICDEELETKYDAYIINLIHDSVLIDCPADEATVQAVSKLMSSTMRRVPAEQLENCTIPFVCDTDLGPNWGTVKALNNDTMIMDIKGTPKYVDWIKEHGVQIA